MHWEAYYFIKIIKLSFPDEFNNNEVFEIGSYCVNHSIREHFESCEYVGVDLTEGETVDIVASGHEVKLNQAFDLAVSCECFEHNPYFKESLANMIHHLKDNGLLMISCATEGRPEHGTSRTDPKVSPGTSDIGWDYYKNLTKADLESTLIAHNIKHYYFFTNPISHDLYLIGIKGRTVSPLKISQLNQAQKNIQQFIEQSLVFSTYIQNIIHNKAKEVAIEGLGSLFTIIKHDMHPLFLNKFNNVFPLIKNTSLSTIVSAGYDECLNLYPTDYLSWLNKSNVEQKKGNLELALNAVLKAMKLNDYGYMLDTAYLSLLFQLKQYDEAISLSMGMKANHLNDASFHLLLAEIAIANKNKELAETSAKISFYLGNVSPRSYLVYIEALITNGKFEEAKFLLQGVLNKHGHLPWVYLKKANVLILENKQIEAISCLKLGCYHFPANEQLIQLLKNTTDNSLSLHL